jgi:hypothetical protein
MHQCRHGQQRVEDGESQVERLLGDERNAVQRMLSRKTNMSPFIIFASHGRTLVVEKKPSAETRVACVTPDG